MYLDFKKIIKVLLFVILGIVIGVAGVKITDRLIAPQTASVIGFGEVDATTDQATISIEVKNTSTTQKKAQEENKKDSKQLKDALIKLGIPESRITQSSFTPPFIYGTEESPAQFDQGMRRMPPIDPNNNLTATTNFTVVLDSLKNIQNVYSVITANPNTRITDTYYSLNNRKNWESKAKEIALKDARSQIESIAKINHLRVGKLISLTDTYSSQPFFEQTFKGEEMLNAEGAQPDQVTAEKQAQPENVYYSEQTIKITASYDASYELY